jgi:hypothetical protein
MTCAVSGGAERAVAVTVAGGPCAPAACAAAAPAPTVRAASVITVSAPKPDAEADERGASGSDATLGHEFWGRCDACGGWTPIPGGEDRARCTNATCDHDVVRRVHAAPCTPHLPGH